MKLLHIITSLEIGGAQRLLSDLLPIQKEQGIDVSLLVYEEIDNAFAQKIKDAGVPILSLRQTNFKSPANILKIRRIIRNYDIVHVHLFPSLYWVALAAIGLNHTKLVWTEHSTNNQRRNKWYFRPIEKWIYRHYKALVSISEKAQIALTKWLQSNDERFLVIDNGIDVSMYEHIKKPVRPKSLIMVSRFVPAKDQATLILAMKRIDEDATLRFVGDGEKLEECKQLAREEGVADRIEFLGARSDVAELIMESYIGIQSSHWEGLCLTALEIMAAGKPIIASYANGVKEIVEGYGEVFEIGDDMQLASYVNRLLEDKTYYNQMAKHCLERAKQYDVHQTAEAYAQIYKSI